MAIDMKALARAGAEARVRALLAEIAEIRQVFPGVGSGSATGAGTGAGRGRRGAAETGGAAAPKAARKRKPMSAAQRKAVAERMKAYWAGRRKDKK